jgi:dsDNA-specific endonuclease/ATPase MutS2
VGFLQREVVFFLKAGILWGYPAGVSDPEEDLVVVPIEESIDLHNFHPREILEVVDAYLDAALEEGFREVRLIHGRGKGVQRARVQQLLENDPRVVDWNDAPPGRGGWGATLARIQPASRDLG